MKKLIAVAGSIGSGKSSLIDFLCQSYPLLPIHDVAAENPYLDNFFADMKRWSFHSQIFFLARKFARFREIASSFASIVISRTIFEDAEIFARNLYQSGFMTETDFKTYYDFYLSLLDTLPTPDLLIYLHSPVEVSLQRLRQRNDRYGKLIPSRYLARLHRLYVNWIADYDQSEVLIIDTKQLDFIHNLVDRADILKAIERYI